MTYPSYSKRSLGAAGLCLAALWLTPVPAPAQIGAGALTGTNEFAGFEEGETYAIDLAKGSFARKLPFDVVFKVAGPMPARFGSGSRVDARFVEFKRPPDCASFFNQYSLTRQRLADLNESEAIPVRRRQRSVAIETSGFRQATVFDASGQTLQAGLVPIGGGQGGAGEAGPPKGASFIVDFPALRPNHYYCFQFISRRALSKEDLETVHQAFQQAVDEELRRDVYQEERADYTTFKVAVDDYEKMRVTLSAVLEENLANENQVVLAPPDSFFNVGATLGEIGRDYREEFEKIAVRTVGARLAAIKNFDQELGNAVRALRQVAETKYQVPVEGDEDAKQEMTGLALVLARQDRPGVAEFMQRLRDAGLEPGELVSFSEEQLGKRLMGVPIQDRLTAPALKNVWDPQVVQQRIDSLQALSAALENLIPLATEAGIDLEARQVNVTPISKQQVENSRQTLARLRSQIELFDDAIAEPGNVELNPSELTAAELREIKADRQAEIDALEKTLADQEAQLAKGDVTPRVNLVYQATRFLGDAVTNLQSLQRLLEERSADIGDWVRQVLVEERASLVVGATTVADYDTRAKWYMSADIGSGISELEDFFTYVGWNIYLRPVNKKAHLSWAARPFGVGEELLRRFSFTLGVVQTGFDEKDGQFKGVIGGNAAVLGAGFRINDSLRFSVGGLLFESQNPDPLIDSSKLEWSPYMAISVDWNIGASLSGLLTGGQPQE